ncbi:hypothetical protein [Rahnella inusitata]
MKKLICGQRQLTVTDIIPQRVACLLLKHPLKVPFGIAGFFSDIPNF